MKINYEEKIQKKIAEANGRRYERLIDYNDVLQAIWEAHRNGRGYRIGGTVANSYRYPAITSVVFAYKNTKTKSIIVAIGTNNAKVGCAPRPDRLRSELPSVTGTRCAGKMQEWAETNTQKDIVLSKSVYRPMLAMYLSDQKNQNIPREMLQLKVPVTVQDSINAGNCITMTNEVKSWFKTESVPANKLLKLVSKRSPHLLRYALNAVEFAKKRTEAPMKTAD